MSENLNELFYENDIIYNNITQLLFFLDNIFNEYNNIIVKRFRKLDFYDLFFYMLYYNSSINETHTSSNYNFNVENKNKNNVSENAFINIGIKIEIETFLIFFFIILL